MSSYIERARRLKKKLLIGLGCASVAILLVAAGFYLAFFSMIGLEMNDRLKYEAAYLKGYVAIQKRLYAGDTAGAQQTIDFLIDAHAKTLFEFSYLQSSALSQDIDLVLCRVVQLRVEHPRKATYVGGAEAAGEIDTWYSDIDQYVKSQGARC